MIKGNPNNICIQLYNIVYIKNVQNVPITFSFCVPRSYF